MRKTGMINQLSCWIYTAALTVCMTSSFAADHRESRLTQEDPAADINDIYLFRSPADPQRVVVALTVNPFSVPAEAITYNFSDNVEYAFHFDTDGDARAERTLRAYFHTGESGVQSYWLVNGRGRVLLSGEATQPTEEPVANEAIVTGAAGGIRMFAGPREDPFFFDAAGVLRFLAGTGAPNGTDAFAGFNVSAIVLELPQSFFGPKGIDQLGVWATTSRERLELRNSSSRPLLKRNGKRRFFVPRAYFGRFTQVERMGNPAVSTVLVPAPLKDIYNATKPANDANDYADALVGSLQALGTSDDNIGVLASVAVPDILNIDLTTPTGFPNGRAPGDDVIDTLLTLITNGAVTGDGVDSNDAAFDNEMPYLAEPFQAP